MHKFTRLFKRISLPITILAGLGAILMYAINIKEKIQLYRDSKNVSIDFIIKDSILKIKKGETKPVFNNELLQITIDKIILMDENNLYKMIGKVDDGSSTRNFERAQGESIQFSKYIIQLNRIASDYVEFRVSVYNY